MHSCPGYIHQYIDGVLHEYVVRRPGRTSKYNGPIILAALLSILLVVASLTTATAAQIVTAATVMGLLALLLGLQHITEERLVVQAGVGLTLESRNWFGKAIEFEFIDQAHVTGVIINEVLTTTDIYYCLCFSLVDGQRLAVAFKHVRPRLNVLVPIYRTVLRLVLPGGKDQGTDGMRV